jgi:hypothetical protein
MNFSIVGVIFAPHPLSFYFKARVWSYAGGEKPSRNNIFTMAFKLQ